MKTREEFFSSLGAAFSEVSNLALLCFETGIFPLACTTLNSLEMSLINHESSLSDIKMKVNDIFKKSNERETKSEKDITRGSSPSTLLSLADNHISNTEHSHEKKFYICEEDVSKGNVVTCHASSDVISDKQISTDNPCDRTENAASENRIGLLENSRGDVNKVNRVEELKKGDTSMSPPLNTSTNKNDDSSTRKSPCLHKVHRITSSTLREYVDIDEADVFMDANKARFLPESIESVLCTSDDTSNCQSCVEDQCRACFVLRYFPLLDLRKIRAVLSWQQKCRWRTCLAYLVHLEGKFMVAFCIPLV